MLDLNVSFTHATRPQQSSVFKCVNDMVKWKEGRQLHYVTHTPLDFKELVQVERDIHAYI